MRAREFLIEKARGLLYRSPGDAFKDPTGQEIRFVQAIYYPGMPGAYRTPEEMEQARQKIEKKYRGIKWVNNKNNSTLAAAVLEFDIIRNGQSIGKSYFGRYFKQIMANMEGSWKNDDLPGNWQLQKASSLKSSFKLKPSDIFSPGAEFNTPLDLINAMSQSANGAQWAQETAALLAGKMPVYKGAKDKETAIRDDLGEILGPIAVVQDMIKSPGIEEAKRTLNNNNALAGTIKFGGSKTEGLKDSDIIISPELTVAISSKGKSGATASIKNAYDGIESLRKKIAQGDTTAQELLNKYKNAVDILQKIATSSQLDGPLVLATDQSIMGDDKLPPLLNQNDVDLIKQLISQNHKDLTMIAADEPTKNKLAMLTTTISANRDNPSYNIGYHILAGLAKKVAELVNNNKEIKFSEACLKFINSTPIIQVYTFTKVVGDDVHVTKFDALYPPNFKGNILLDPSKVYYATGINGRYTFKYSPTAEPQTVDQPATTQKPKTRSKR